MLISLRCVVPISVAVMGIGTSGQSICLTQPIRKFGPSSLLHFRIGDPSEYVITIGEYDLMHSDPGSQELGIEKFYKHEEVWVL